MREPTDRIFVPNLIQLMPPPPVLKTHLLEQTDVELMELVQQSLELTRTIFETKNQIIQANIYDLQLQEKLQAIT